MEALGCSGPDADKPWESTVQTALLHKDTSLDGSLLTSADLQALLQRTSFDSLDVCQLASSPESLFSPKGTQELALPAADGGSLFAELFPGSLLFPSPAAVAGQQIAAAGAPAAAARLPTKIHQQLAPAGAVVVSGAITHQTTLDVAAAAGTGPAAARNLMLCLDSCTVHDSEGQLAAERSPKRRRTALFQQQQQEPMQAEDSYPLEDSEMEMDLGSSELEGSALEGMLYGGGGGAADARLESKRARNREAARRMRQRQRQHIGKLEDEVGGQYNTIQGLLGKLGMLAKEMKCTTQENDLLKHLLTTAAAVAAPAPDEDNAGLPSAAQLPLGFPPGCNDDSLLDGSLFVGVQLPPGSPQEHYLLPPGRSGTVSAGCSPMKFFGPAAPAAGPSVAPSPAGVPPPRAASSLLPSPFESPQKQRPAPSPSKPLTPQRLALRSPFAGAPLRPSRLSVSAAAPTCAAGKAALLEQLASGQAPLQHGVALALLRGLQDQQEMELGGEGPQELTEEEAVMVAATALLHSQGNVNMAVMQLLAWGGFVEDVSLAARQ